MVGTPSFREVPGLQHRASGGTMKHNAHLYGGRDDAWPSQAHVGRVETDSRVFCVVQAGNSGRSEEAEFRQQPKGNRLRTRHLSEHDADTSPSSDVEGRGVHRDLAGVGRSRGPRQSASTRDAGRSRLRSLVSVSTFAAPKARRPASTARPRRSQARDGRPEIARPAHAQQESHERERSRLRRPSRWDAGRNGRPFQRSEPFPSSRLAFYCRQFTTTEQRLFLLRSMPPAG